MKELFIRNDTMFFLMDLNDEAEVNNSWRLVADPSSFLHSPACSRSALQMAEQFGVSYEHSNAGSDPLCFDRLTYGAAGVH